MIFKAKILDIEAGAAVAVLNEEEASRLNLSRFDRIKISNRQKEVTAIVDISRRYVMPGEIGLFSEVAELLEAKNKDILAVNCTPRPASLDYIRKKLDGASLSSRQIHSIIRDMMKGRLSEAELSAFISAFYTIGASEKEVLALTNAIFESGKKINIRRKAYGLHSIGGVAGDRSSMIVVPIIASLGLCIPKTSSGAISSASSTADAMSVLAPVSLKVGEVEKVIKKTNACLVWGGAGELAAADDRLIKVRYSLHLDPSSFIISSILAKKLAESINFFLLDIPVGRGAKIEKIAEGRKLAREFEKISKNLKINMKSIITNGASPLSSYIGPALEAKRVLEILEGKAAEPLLEKSITLSSKILSAAKKTRYAEARSIVKKQIKNKKALDKLMEIIVAQGGKEISSEEVEIGKYRKKIESKVAGRIKHIDNRNISKICRMLGAPFDKKAGMILCKKKGEKVERGEILFELISDSKERIENAERMLKIVYPIEIS